MTVGFTYETYQDVRRNLFKYSVPFLVATGFFVYFFVLPPIHRAAVTRLVEYVLETPPWRELLGVTVWVALFVGLAFLLTEVLQVHDQFYDKYVIKWRFRYATDFILPRLVQPFACHLNYRFHETAEKNIGEFQDQLYYPFVGDRDLKIPKNKLVRFYEVVTVYWLTQLNELILLVLAILVALYRFLGPPDLAYRTLLLNDALGLAACFLMNRLWMHFFREKVRRATEEEIRAIHDDEGLVEDLRQRLKQICADYSVPYREHEKTRDSA